MSFFQPGSVLNTQAMANKPETVEVPFLANRDPTPNDILYPIGKHWIHIADSEWVLLNFTSAGANLQANWVEFAVSGGSGIEQITVDGTTQVITPSGTPKNVNITGNTVANGTHVKPLYFLKTATSSGTIDIQLATTVAATPANNTSCGISCFRNTQFTIDATSGMVSLNGSGVGQTITGNSGGAISPVAGNWNLLTANATVTFVGTAGTETLDFGLSNLILGSAPAVSGIANVGLGQLALNSLAGGSGCVAIGQQALKSFTSGGGGVGNNIAIGQGCMANLVTGTRNIVIGATSGNAYIGAESNNILINNTGVASEANTIRIGTQGSGSGQQNRVFLAGIVGTTVIGNFVNVKSDGQLGEVSSASIAQTLTGNDSVAVSPTAGNINLIGSTVANGTNAIPLYVKSTGGSTETIQLQIAKLVTPTPANTNGCGISCYNTNQFQFDSTSGMVSLKGGTVNPPLTGVIPDASTAPGTNPVVSNSSGNITIEGGATYATGTRNNPIRTNSLSANTLDLEIQLAGSNASSAAANKYGVSQFDSNYYTVTNGYVTDALANDTFFVYLSADTSSQTGDGTQYTIPFDTKTGTGWDANSNFTTGAGALYTTPVQGEYEFEASVRLQTTSGSMAAHTRLVMWIWATNGSGTDYQVCEFGNFTGAAAARLTDAPNPDGITLTGATRMRLPSGYKVTVRVSVDGVTKNVFVGGLGGTTKVTYFSGRCVSIY